MRISNTLRHHSAPGQLKWALQRWPYLAIVLLLLLVWSGFISRGKAPFVVIQPGFWPQCNDFSEVHYSSYISGRNLLEGFSKWSFCEGLGNNFYVDCLARYFNPFNILGAFLIDHFNIGVFQFFGSLGLFLFALFLWGCIYYFKHVAGYSNNWAFFGAILCGNLSVNVAYFSNYLGIFLFFPFCLIAIDYFFKHTSLKSCLVFLIVLSAPLFFGMINIYVNYLIMASLVTTVYIIGIKDALGRFRFIGLSLIIFLGAIISNSVMWGPIAIEMFKSTGQLYNSTYDLPIINPFKLPIEALWNLFWGQGIPRWVDRALGFPEHYSVFFELRRLSLFIFFVGLFFSFRKKNIYPAVFWCISIIGFGLFYFLCRVLNLQDLIRIFNLLKFIKYQSAIGTIFVALFIVEGCRILLGNDISKRFKSIASGYLFILLLLIMLILLLVTFSPFLSYRLNPIFFSMVTPIPLDKDVFIFPVYRFQLMSEPNYYPRIFYLIGLSVTICAFLWVIRSRRSRVLIKTICLLGVLFITGYYPYMKTGGFHMSKETYAEDYFKPQQNEAAVIRLLERDSFQYRAIYCDDLGTFRRVFPDDHSYKNFVLPAENRGSNYEFHTRKYVYRAGALGISVPDGIMAFPSRERRDFFVSGDVAGEYFPNMDGLAWNMHDPLNPSVAKKFNVKYVLSHFPLPKMKLISKNDDYWGYLYETSEALPICRIVPLQKNDFGGLLNAGIRSFHLLPDRIQVQAFSNYRALLRINITADSYWRVVVNGQKASLKVIDGMFLGVDIPEGESRVEFTYAYWPVYFFAFISIIGIGLSFLWIRGILQGGRR